jgi:hypothetical protein
MALEQINTILLSMGLPIVLYGLFNVVQFNIRDVITSTQSSFELQVVKAQSSGYYFDWDVYFFRESFRF